MTLESQEKQMLMSRSKWGENENENESQHAMFDCCGIIDGLIQYLHKISKYQDIPFSKHRALLLETLDGWIQYGAE